MMVSPDRIWLYSRVMDRLVRIIVAPAPIAIILVTLFVGLGLWVAESLGWVKPDYGKFLLAMGLCFVVNIVLELRKPPPPSA